MDLVLQVLSHPLIYTLPVLMPIAKVIPIVLIVGVMACGNKLRRAFNGYVALLHLAFAFFQNMAVTDKYGLAIASGNLALILVVALAWIWEVFAERNDLTPRQRPLWAWWVAPLAALALLAPIDAKTNAPDFSPLVLLANESGLTYCMMTPVILSVLNLFYPTVNLAVLRVSSFVGIIFALINVTMWFVVMPSGWWMGVLHIPLLVISVCAFVIAQHKLCDGGADAQLT